MESVEVVRKLYEFWQTRDAEAGAKLVDPDIEFVRIGEALGDLAGEWRGSDAMWRAIFQWLQAWDELTVTAERFIELDDGRVLVLDRQVGRGRSSSATLEHDLATIFTVRDGRLTRLVAYWDRADALRDAGIDAEDLA
jgi:ketosteroid isomerase-like protein